MLSVKWGSIANGKYRTTVLGYNFSAPFFICPCGGQIRSNPEAEKGLVEAAGAEDILYIVSVRLTAV